MQIKVDFQSGVYIYEDDIWWCQHLNTDTQTYITYWPTQEQIDMGTDRDEEVEVTICLDCREQIDD